MSMVLLLLFLFVIAERIAELWLAERNRRWMLQKGGYEVGADHYNKIIWIHICVFIGIAVECMTLDTEPPAFWKYVLLMFLALEVLRVGCIFTLGRFWNTRIVVLPGSKRVKRGIYSYVKHPNYLIVMLETFLFPFLYGAYLTAFLLPILNGLFLYFVRIPAEEKALAEPA